MNTFSCSFSDHYFDAASLTFQNIKSIAITTEGRWLSEFNNAKIADEISNINLDEINLYESAYQMVKT